MFRLDYLSCFLTILATVLVGRKSWTGLLISIVNSSIVCVIGFRTSQFGFIPANIICICVYAFSIRSWLKKAHTRPIRNHGRAASVPSSSVLGAKRASRPTTMGQQPLKFNSAARNGSHVVSVARTRKRMDLANNPLVNTRRRGEILTADPRDSQASVGLERILTDGSRVRLLVNAGAGATAPLNLEIADMSRMIALRAG